MLGSARVRETRKRKINRLSKRADRAARNEQKTGIKRVFMSLYRAGEPHRRERHDAGEQYHDYAQPVDASREAQPPLGRDAKRCDVLEVGVTVAERRKQK